jgi:hypothetical protein
VVYVNVKSSPEGMQKFMQLSNGGRRVPLIEQAGKVTIGFGGT